MTNLENKKELLKKLSEIQTVLEDCKEISKDIWLHDDGEDFYWIGFEIDDITDALDELIERVVDAKLISEE